MSNLDFVFESGHALDVCATVAPMINCNTMFTALDHADDEEEECTGNGEEREEEQVRAIKEWSRGMQNEGENREIFSRFFNRFCIRSKYLSLIHI